MNPIDIDSLSYEELRALNRRIVERLKYMDHVRNLMQVMDYRVGDEVTFNGSDGNEISGIVSKLNKKTVSVITKSGEQWNVSPQLLSKPPRKVMDSEQIDNIIHIDQKKQG
jgi:transcription antitermination factor NusA-like protein